MILLSALLLLSPQALERVESYSQGSTMTTTHQVDVLSSSGGTSANQSFHFDLIPTSDVDGVSMTQLLYISSYVATSTVDVSPDPANVALGVSTSIEGSYGYNVGGSSADPAWPGYGCSDFGSLSGSIVDGRIIESFHSSGGHYDSYSGVSGNENIDPDYFGNGGASLDWSISTTNPGSGEAFIHSEERYVSTSATYIRTLSYQPIPTVEYCTSQSNATGETSSLAAYGNAESGSAFLALKLTDFQPFAAGILFRAPNFANTPAATYTVCIGSGADRVGGVQADDGSGELIFDLDLEGYVSGQSVYFQAIHRDSQFDICASSAIAMSVQ